jgi:DNA-binding LacI/PurR family transcriptional regulator
MNDIIRGICRDLLTQISNGEIKAGDSLPPEMQLAEIFKTNRMNAHHAVKVLERKGLVIRKKRIGTILQNDIDQNIVTMLLKEVNKIVYVLYSKTPHWIHWNETSFQALEKEVTASGYSVLYDHIPDSDLRKDYVATLKKASDAGASALVIFPDIEDAIFLANNGDLLLDFQMPVYMLNRRGEPKSLDMVSFVSMAHFSDGITVGTLLKKHGCKNIAMFNEPTGEAFWGCKRYEGLLVGLQHGKGKKIPLQENILFSPQGCQRAVELIKQQQGNMVIVAVNNHYAAKIIDFAQEQGLTIPADYQLITFDDNPEFRSYNLTSMGVPMQKIGEVFGKLICDKSWLEEFRGKVSIKVNSELVTRKTFN